MSKLYLNFQAYLRMNIPKTKWIVLVGILFLFLFLFLKKKGYVKKYKKRLIPLGWGMLLSMNCSFIIVMTLLGRRIHKVREYRVIPFESTYHVFVEGNVELLLQIIMNIAMYIPLGVLLPCCFKVFDKYRCIICTAFVSSLTIEFIQAIFKIGLFELDDIINNVLGATIGVLIYALFSKLKKSRNYERNNQEIT